MFLCKLRLVTLFLLFVSVNTRSAPEPLCSKFAYDEQLLEKMVRVEFNVNNMEKNMLETKRSMQETETTMKETDTSMREVEKTIRESEQRMRKTEADMKETDASMQETEKTIRETEQRMRETLANLTASEKRMEETQKNMMNSLKEFDEKRKTLQQLEVKLETMIGKTVVAFHAHKAADKSVANYQVFVFTEVLLNEGSGYSSNDGYFTAPVSGIYFLNCHLCVRNEKNLNYLFKVNSITHASGLFTANGDGRCTSFSVTVLMRSGERACVTIDGSGSSSTDLLYEDNDDWNYFSGFLVRQTT